MNVRFFSDHCVIFVVGIVCITELAVRSEFELQELMAEFSFMTNIVPQIKIPVTTHFQKYVLMLFVAAGLKLLASYKCRIVSGNLFFLYSVYFVIWLVYSKKLPLLIKCFLAQVRGKLPAT